jgi:transcriptional regulator with XRE-family HTH domain
MLVGGRIKSRRIHLGLAVDCVAQEVGIDPGLYENYEAGAEQVPASVLDMIAELLGMPVMWFFEDVAEIEEADRQSSTSSYSPRVYRVATAEERVRFLSDAFCKLDLEGQQHLLCIAAALAQSVCRSAAGTRVATGRLAPTSSSRSGRQGVQRISKPQNSSRRSK